MPANGTTGSWKRCIENQASKKRLREESKEKIAKSKRQTSFIPTIACHRRRKSSANIKRAEYLTESYILSVYWTSYLTARVAKLFLFLNILQLFYSFSFFFRLGLNFTEYFIPNFQSIVTTFIVVLYQKTSTTNWSVLDHIRNFNLSLIINCN